MQALALGVTAVKVARSMPSIAKRRKTFNFLKPEPVRAALMRSGRSSRNCHCGLTATSASRPPPHRAPAAIRGLRLAWLEEPCRPGPVLAEIRAAKKFPLEIASCLR